MQRHVNPFNDLYVTEIVSPSSFVHVFSPLLVPDTLPLYESGNVVLMGTQGTGKSMLLALFKPEIRLAYAAEQRDFPLHAVHPDLARFIGAGINLTTSGAYSFGQRQIEEHDDATVERVPYYFGDFINYWIVRDILRSIELLANSPHSSVRDDLGLKFDSRLMDSFAVGLAKNDSWCGSLQPVSDFESLKTNLQGRLTTYRSFLNFNCESLPAEIQSTKTFPGEPISATIEHLWSAGIVPRDIRFFVQIDQYEELARLEAASRERGILDRYQRLIDGMIARRDPAVSYRIGSRRHAWNAEHQDIGTPVVVEEFRNYEIVDLDELLGGGEHRRNVFKDFCDDVFRRRLETSGYEIKDSEAKPVNSAFGAKVAPETKASFYTKAGSTGFIDVEKDWPANVSKLLIDIAKSDPISAKLGEAWVRQQSDTDDPILPSKNSLPWEEDQKKWWRKERVSQALLQIAAGNRQRMMWAGAEDIRGLSSGHILIFLSICKYIWGSWLRSDPPAEAELKAPTIDNAYLQDAGIQQASKYWYRKVKSDPRGDTRRRFISFLGSYFRDKLRRDKKMSYPGANGFSVSVVDLEQDTQAWRFLEEAAAFGVLVERRHTSRTKNRGESIKWYLHPILCPFFDIPYQHIKEPLEVKISDVRGWLSSDKVRAVTDKVSANATSSDRDSTSGQMRLFDDVETDAEC